MKTVVALPGEGIGIEMVDATCEVWIGTGLPLKILTPPQGELVPEETQGDAREAEGVLFGADAQRLESAVGRVYRDGKTRTPDQGGTAKTRDMAEAVLAAHRSA